VSRGVLDTSVLIAGDVHPLPGELAVSVVSFAELQFGVLVAKSADVRAIRLSRLSVLQRRFEPALPIDDAVADSYGQLAAKIANSGRNPRGRVTDLLIAATAHAHDAAVYTRNPDDLRGLEGLVNVVPV
jgi:predicted nucleic acid-binding protein